jgi:hypothetical protein
LKHLIQTVNGLAARKIGFQSLRESMDTTTSGGKLIFHVFGALAEFERERVHLGLNKGEARNSLARAIFFYRRGAVRDRLREDLQNKASGLNLVVAAIVLWNTVYLEQAVAALERQGTPVPADCLPHLSPLGWEHINLTGDYIWDLRQTTTLQRLRSLRRSYP